MIFESVFIISYHHSTLGEENGEDTNAFRKISLEKLCPNCIENRGERRKMAVKFNFDHVESTNGDAWVEFTCHFCKKYVST